MSSESAQYLPRIAIIGAGPAGCTLARLLTIQSIPVVIFEGEPTINVRSQGGTLDLHEDTGLAALKEAGLYSAFLKQARFDGDAIKLCDKHMRSYLNLGSSAEKSWLAQGKPEIDRSALRALLLESLPEGMIRWGCRLKLVEPKDGTLVFEHGIERGFDLVVGADGAWSKVRPMLTDVKPFYSGVGGFTATIADVARRAPEVHKLVNRGSWFNYSDGSMILGQQMGDGSLYVTVWQIRDQNWQRDAKFDIWDGKAVRQELCKEYADWSPEVLMLLQAIDDKGVVPRSLYMLPVDFRWENKPGFTLLGDAAHLMTPFVGEGVNTAMKDATELARVIVHARKGARGPEGLYRQIKKYEEDMFVRVNKVQRKTEDMMNMMMFTRGAPGTTIERWIIRAMSDDLHRLLLPVVRLLVFAFYFFYKLLL